MKKTILKSILMSILGGSLLISTQVFAESDASALAKECRADAIKGGITGNGYGPFMKLCTSTSGPGVEKGGKPTQDTTDPFQEG